METLFPSVPVVFLLLVSQVVPHLAQHPADVREGHVRVRLSHLGAENRSDWMSSFV